MFSIKLHGIQTHVNEQHHTVIGDKSQRMAGIHNGLHSSGERRFHHAHRRFYRITFSQYLGRKCGVIHIGQWNHLSLQRIIDGQRFARCYAVLFAIPGCGCRIVMLTVLQFAGRLYISIGTAFGSLYISSLIGHDKGQHKGENKRYCKNNHRKNDISSAVRCHKLYDGCQTRGRKRIRFQINQSGNQTGNSAGNASSHHRFL